MGNRSIFIAVILLPLLLANSSNCETIEELKKRYLDSIGTTVLNSKELTAIQLADEWINKQNKPVMMENGKIIYQFGVSLPAIVCAPLNACDLELQQGETIKDVHVGDTARWKVAPAASGLDGSETPHIIIKPTDEGLSTAMIVTTDKRTYHLKLVSSKENWIPSIGFEYPEDTIKMWEGYYNQQQQKEQKEKTIRERKTLDYNALNIEDLDFGYEIMGDTRWKPFRVYNTGVKTIIQMPYEMNQTEAPVLLVGEKGDRLVNYRILKDLYIVDQIFDHAWLIAGKGSEQDKIVITRIKGKSKSTPHASNDQEK